MLTHVPEFYDVECEQKSRYLCGNLGGHVQDFVVEVEVGMVDRGPVQHVLREEEAEQLDEGDAGEPEKAVTSAAAVLVTIGPASHHALLVLPFLNDQGACQHHQYQYWDEGQHLKDHKVLDFSRDYQEGDSAEPEHQQRDCPSQSRTPCFDAEDKGTPNGGSGSNLERFEEKIVATVCIALDF